MIAADAATHTVIFTLKSPDKKPPPTATLLPMHFVTANLSCIQDAELGVTRPSPQTPITSPAWASVLSHAMKVRASFEGVRHLG